MAKWYPPRVCRNEGCGKTFEPTGPAAKFCSTCGPVIAKRVQREGIDRYRAKKGVKVGTGSGSQNKRGAEDSQYKNGITFFIRMGPKIREERRFCERCPKDLIDAAPGEWAIHHRDHDRNHNVIENFELLCKRCHQLEHECWRNLPPRKGPATAPTPYPQTDTPDVPQAA